MTWSKQRWKPVEIHKLLWMFLWRQYRSARSYLRDFFFLTESSCFLKRWASVVPQHWKKLRGSQVVMLPAPRKLLSCAAGCWRQSSRGGAPLLPIRSGVTFLSPALTQVSAHSYQQALQVVLRVCPLEIQIFLNSEPPWPLSLHMLVSLGGQ